MPVDVYFKQDIAQILSAVDQAGGGTAALVNQEIERATQNGHALETEELADHLRIYRQCYRDALNAVATAFGIGTRLTIREAKRVEPPATMEIRRRVTTLSDLVNQ